MSRGVNVLALVKGTQRYVFLYDDASLDHLRDTLAQHASDPELNFTWYDCAVLMSRARQQVADAAATQRQNRLNNSPLTEAD